MVRHITFMLFLTTQEASQHHHFSGEIMQYQIIEITFHGASLHKMQESRDFFILPEHKVAIHTNLNPFSLPFYK